MQNAAPRPGMPLATKLGFLLSAAALTSLLAYRGQAWQQLLCVGLAVGILAVGVFRHALLEKMLAKAAPATVICAVGFSVLALYENCLIWLDFSAMRIRHMLPWFLLAGLGLYAATVFFTWFLCGAAGVARHLWQSAAQEEKWMLLAGGVVVAAAIVWATAQTSAFTLPLLPSGREVLYDVIYTTDTGAHNATNSYMVLSAVENDIRQPLFGLFALPFACVARALSLLLFFIPKGYMVFNCIIQAVVLQLAMVLVCRVLGLQGAQRVLLFMVLCLGWPALLYTFAMEQYIFATFWLLLLVWARVQGQPHREFFFIAATGSMLTSATMFPLAGTQKKPGPWFVQMLKLAGTFLAVLVVAGRLPVLLDLVQNLGELVGFTGVGTPFAGRWLQYLNFVCACFLAPASFVQPGGSYPSYQLAPVQGANVVGAVLLALAVLGFVLNHKDPFARICAFWALNSFVVLCAVGWGTGENGLVLYVLYYAWAFAGLLWRLVQRLVKNSKVRLAVLGAGVVATTVVNLPALWQLLQFGTQHYPSFW